MESTNVAMVRRAFEEIDRGNTAVIAELIAPNFERHDLSQAFPEGAGLEKVLDYLGTLKRGLPDMRITIDQIFGADDYVTVRYTFTGTHNGEVLGIAPTGRSVQVAGINIYRCKGGKVAETWQLGDWMGFLRQVDVSFEGMDTPG